MLGGSEELRSFVQTVETSAYPKMYMLISPMKPASPLLISSKATLPGLGHASKYRDEEISS